MDCKKNHFPRGKVNKQKTEKMERKGKDKPIFIFLSYKNNKEILREILELSRCRLRSFNRNSWHSIFIFLFLPQPSKRTVLIMWSTSLLSIFYLVHTLSLFLNFHQKCVPEYCEQNAVLRRNSICRHLLLWTFHCRSQDLFLLPSRAFVNISAFTFIKCIYT